MAMAQPPNDLYPTVMNLDQRPNGLNQSLNQQVNLQRLPRVHQVRTLLPTVSVVIVIFCFPYFPLISLSATPTPT